MCPTKINERRARKRRVSERGLGELWAAPLVMHAYALLLPNSLVLHPFLSPTCPELRELPCRPRMPSAPVALVRVR